MFMQFLRKKNQPNNSVASSSGKYLIRCCLIKNYSNKIEQHASNTKGSIPRRDAPIYYSVKCLSKTAWKWKNLYGERGSVRPECSPDPPQHCFQRIFWVGAMWGILDLFSVIERLCEPSFAFAHAYRLLGWKKKYDRYINKKIIFSQNFTLTIQTNSWALSILYKRWMSQCFLISKHREKVFVIITKKHFYYKAKCSRNYSLKSGSDESGFAGRQNLLSNCQIPGVFCSAIPYTMTP